ncbi:MAG: hypothetical protein GXO22_02060 [Aquificae bacterium]|nr:hypothetical protein [Aquificota bacterium]
MLFFSFAFAKEDLNRLLLLIQGAYNDKVYSIAAQKAEEYLKKAPKDDPKREKVIKILAGSYYFTKNDEKLLQLIRTLDNENISLKEKKEILVLGAKLLKEKGKEQELIQVLEKLLPLTTGKEREKIIESLGKLYYKYKMWDKLIALPDLKSINMLKVLAAYKLGNYYDVLRLTARPENFLPEQKDDALYYRGLAFIKLGKEEMAVKTFEQITFKTPKIIEFLANYYFKKKDFIRAERYYKLLTLEKDYKDYAYYMLGVIQEQYKSYKKAVEYYKKASKFNTKYGKLAKERIIAFKKAGIISKEKFYTVRTITLFSEEKAKRVLKQINLDECFIKDIDKTKFIIYCGLYKTKQEAQEMLQKIKKLGFSDAYITKIEEILR